jgi:3-methyladenine DNA glycosylase Tag
MARRGRSMSLITTLNGACPSATIELYGSSCWTGFQAGLSWITILRKRAFRRAFDDFAPEKIARYSKKKVEALMRDEGHRAAIA